MTDGVTTSARPFVACAAVAGAITYGSFAAVITTGLERSRAALTKP